MKKKLFILFAAIMMVVILAACNTSEERARESQRNNMNEVSFGPEDQGMQGDGNGQKRMDPGADGQNRFDANVPYEGMNPNGTSGSMQGPYFFDQDGRYTHDGQEGNQRDLQRNDQAEQQDDAGQQSDQANGDFQEQVIELTNKAREKNGLSPLKNSNEVEEVAQTKSEDMAQNDYFSHTSPTYGSPFDMLKEFGVDYSTAAENIAAGQQSPQAVVDGWLNSSGHRKNIMNENVTHIGVGHAEDGDYWVQMFIAK
ncbi:CAP domain-containing protein [Halobacillus karajensis]|uniref:Cysteine-rich secretory protein family protein n=1 Tax=Halobacillus karajensis TaxID=195088 RepID=A0A059NYL0_9BACI|nr:CAP domain-containing protein [Halobacillus karajensis]CDQ18627.1 Cysteine-rich secretory protein family protein [Halobacillus karajensis]CDQ23301.1 Cysteine-rich secretory protein family protein [Halobacillus karajensis]CDQ26783.1 Cysteine-rich secretory protein family protein [Halobacillus karajensis]